MCLADVISSQFIDECKEEKKAGQYLLFLVSLSEFHTLYVLEVKWWSEENLSRASVLQHGNVLSHQCSKKTKTKNKVSRNSGKHRTQKLADIVYFPSFSLNLQCRTDRPALTQCGQRLKPV